MTSITTTQKIIKVGSSGAVTIPAKIMKQFGATYGDNIEVEFHPVVKTPSDDKVELVALTQQLIKRHEQALKNLSQR